MGKSKHRKQQRDRRRAEHPAAAQEQPPVAEPETPGSGLSHVPRRKRQPRFGHN